MSEASPKVTQKSKPTENEKIEPSCRFLRELTDEEWKDYWKYTLHHL